LPSLKRPWYYIHLSKPTINFYLKYLFGSRRKSINALFYLLFKILPYYRLLKKGANKIDELPDNLTLAISKIQNVVSVDHNSFIIRLTTWDRKNDRFVLFIFKESNEKPSFIAKCLSDQYSNLLEAEFNNLKKVVNYFNKSQINIPTPVKFINTENQAIYLENYCTGIALNNLGNRELLPGKKFRLFIRGLAITCQVIKIFSQNRKAMDGKTIEKYFETPLRKFEETIPLAGEYPKNLNKLKEDLTRFKERNLFSIPMHGDLWGGSILINHHQNTVIDWEFFQEQGVPLWDFFMFVVHPGFALKGSTNGIKTEFLSFWFNDKGKEIIHNSLRELVVKFELDVNDVKFLFQSFLIYSIFARDNDKETNWGNLLGYCWRNHLVDNLFDQGNFCVQTIKCL